MNIYPQLYNPCNKKISSKSVNNSVGYNNVNFGARKNNDVGSINKVNPKKSFLSKAKAYILASLIVGGTGFNACNSSVEKTSEVMDNIKVECFDVKPDKRDSIMAPVLELKSKLTKENDFIDGIEIDLTHKYRNMDDENSFRTYLKNEPVTSDIKGTSFYSDGKLPRRIVVQEYAHLEDKAANYMRNGKYSDIPSMRQTIMHELGHQFDYYFGHDHNAKFAQSYDSILYSKEMSPDENPYAFDLQDMKDKRIDVEYAWNSGLSDKKIFQEAICKDLNGIKNIKEEDLPVDLKYYLGKLDVSKDITIKDVDMAEHTRSEVYANLFSYGIGQNDGTKEKFIRCFPNSNKVVKNDIYRFLKIK